MIKGPVVIKSNAPNERIFAGVCDEMLDIQSVKTQPINHTFRKFTTEETRESYDTLKESLIKDGLKEPLKVFIANDGIIYSLGGNTRKKILKESACLEVPVLWQTQFEGKDPWDPLLLQANAEDNLRVEASDSSKFETCEEVFRHYPDWTRDKKETYCKGLRFSYKMYEEYKKIKHGFTGKNGWVEPRTDLVKELEEGKLGKSITGQRKSQDNDHKRMMNLDTHKQPESSEINDILTSINSAEMVGGIKQYYEGLRAVTSTRYNSNIFNNCDKQYIGGTIHYISAMILAEEITNCSDNFTAEASENGAAYDVYIKDKFGDIVATVEVKTTQDKNWVSGREKVGYHMLVSHSKELNFFVNVCYLEAGAWEIIPGVGSFILKPKNVGKAIANGAFNHNYAGDIFEDGGDFVVQRSKIN